MNRKLQKAALLLSLAAAAALLPLTSQAQTPAEQSQPGTTNKPTNPVNTPAIPSAVPANTEEDAALKSFQAIPASDQQGKITAGEAFVQKYPQSRYLPAVYSALTLLYLQTGKADKAFEIGDKEVQLKPDDVQTLALLSLTIPRAVSSKTPDQEKQLAKAEDYAKRAIEVTPTIPKPDGMTDQGFVVAKNATLSMAHGGLGLVYFRRSKFNDAIPELEQSIRIDPNATPDPVNLYALGVSDQRTSHFDEAAVAFTKCAAIAGNLQAPCKSGADEAKKQGATQLSAPK